MVGDLRRDNDPSLACFSDGLIPVTINLAGLNLQSIPNRKDGFSVEFPKAPFITPGIGPKAGSGARASASQFISKSRTGAS